MRTSLLEWAANKPSPEETADMTAQLLEYVCENGGMFDPDCFEVETSEEAPFGELISVRNAEDFHSTLRPLKIEEDAGDGVFVTALILYIMLTGAPMDMSMAKMLLVAAQTGQSTPLMHVPQSSLNDLIEQMSDVNPGTRISPEDALSRIAQQFPGSAEITITERQTGAVLERIETGLDRAFTDWKPMPVYECQQQKFFPENDREIRLPYRLKKQTAVCIVQAQKILAPLATDIRGKRCFGIDAGSTCVRIALMSEDGKVSDLEYNGGYMIPAVMAFRSGEVCVFAEETEEPDMNGADILKPFAPCREPDEMFTAKCADGSSVQTTQSELMKRFVVFVTGFMTQTAGFAPDEDKVSLALNTGSSMGWRNTLIDATKTCMTDVCVFPSPDAWAAAYSAENPGCGKLMIVNAGSSFVDISIAGVSKLSPEFAVNAAESRRLLFAAPGGSDMTDMVAKSIMQTVLMRTGMNMYQKDPKLSPTQYAENQRTISDAAERIKCRLSFAESTEETITLNVPSGTSESVVLSYSRQQLESMLRAQTGSIRTCAKQCIDSEKISVSDIGTLLLCGRGALMPAVRDAAKEIGVSGFTMLYDVVSGARGAAILGALMPESNTAEKQLCRTESDIGTMTADVVSGLPEFICLLPAGSEITGECVRFEYTFALTKTDINGEGKAVVKLYSRRAGMEHVKSTLDPEGTAISYMGQMRVSVPEKFDFDEDKLCVEFSLDSKEKLTASGVHLRKSKGIGKFLSKIGVGKEEIRNGYAVIESGLNAVYLPDKS